MPAVFIFPHQLFAEHPALEPGADVYLIEEPLFFADAQTPARMHKQKLALHRASMQAYATQLKHKGHPVTTVGTQKGGVLDSICTDLRQKGETGIRVADPVDDWVEQRLTAAAGAAGLEITTTPSPGFVCTDAECGPFFSGQPPYRQTSFYTAMRKRCQILLDDHGKPLGGKWTFDTANRKRYRGEPPVPDLPHLTGGPEKDSALDRVRNEFANHPGEPDLTMPWTHAQAQAWLEDFVDRRLPSFGPFQDALSSKEPFLFHSLLASSLNIGLLTPNQVLDTVLAKHRQSPLPLASLEGFVRQILGWREFVRGMYRHHGRRQRSTNFWGHSRPLPEAFYTASTGIPPVDLAIQRALSNAYCHHIERLMVLGNFMLLCEIAPDDICTWFMEMCIDSYDWVMVPNVYGMSQYADGGLMSSKPYISSSNYIRKMSDFSPGPWSAVWDGLYWRFIHKQRAFFAANPRLKPMTWHLDKMSRSTLQGHIQTAETYLERLFTGRTTPSSPN
ncbi:cryptochrome/photolyase family protein [Desulfohalobium retbaense]|uniref:Deoxyribodipyrimidine photolyase-related protein n=1 Tax=Desulfohalobium retbaense (strain ATCC 49708 / DSM 5692 / JCM 16813 / HR100) TaxID=485915 RepID=C8X3W0_DESRD|nr:cryptochrome/photolyase family protein [Desulfohalobium retbaense]ACV69107.1 deoxyribodipyrimidine photolyase-related protein [Desulfohalobium retbaense DSM 5692]